MRRKPLNKSARTQSALLASSEVRRGLRASRAMRCCGGGACEKCDLATPSRPDRNGNHGIKFASREFVDKILKFYLLKYNKRSAFSKRRSIKF